MTPETARALRDAWSQLGEAMLRALAEMEPQQPEPAPQVETNGDRLLTVQEVAARLALGEATVYTLAKCGEIPHVRLGKSVRFKPELIEAFIVEKGRQSND